MKQGFGIEMIEQDRHPFDLLNVRHLGRVDKRHTGIKESCQAPGFVLSERRNTTKNMNDQTAKLLEQLASKMGTTSEYLWSILLRQAPIESTITLIQVILIMGVGVVLFKCHKHFMNDKNDMSYYEKEETLGIPMILAAVIWFIFFLAAIVCLDEIINGYFNPEFWALDYIMDKLK